MRTVAELADDVGVRRDDLELTVTLAALCSAMLVAVERWQRHDGRDDLLQIFDDAIAALAAGAASLRDTLPAEGPTDTRPAKPRPVPAKRSR